MICLHSDTPGTTTVCYPGRVFTDDDEGIKSKKFVQRFLDATKSDMLFANKVIMVEGLAEELLLPVMANYMGFSLEDEHVAIVCVGNRYFKHFLKLFDTQESHFAIPTKVVCITDRDPVRKKKQVESLSSVILMRLGLILKTMNIVLMPRKKYVNIQLIRA